MYVGSPSIFVRFVVLNRAKISSVDTSGTVGMKVSIADTMVVGGADSVVVSVVTVAAAGAVAAACAGILSVVIAAVLAAMHCSHSVTTMSSLLFAVVL